MILGKLHRPDFGELGAWTTTTLGQKVAKLPPPFQENGDVHLISKAAKGPLAQIWDEEVYAYSEAAAKSAVNKEAAWSSGFMGVAATALEFPSLGYACIGLAVGLGVLSFLNAREAKQHERFCKALSFRWLPVLKHITQKPSALKGIWAYSALDNPTLLNALKALLPDQGASSV